MLAVAVHEHHGAMARVVEAREQSRFLAEIARQRDDLDIEAVGCKSASEDERRVSTAVVDIDHLGGETAHRLEPACDLDDASMQAERLSASLNSGTTMERPSPERVEVLPPPVRMVMSGTIDRFPSSTDASERGL